MGRRTRNPLKVESPGAQRSIGAELLLVASAAALLSPPALAEKWTVQPSITSQVTATTNSGFNASGQEKSDVLIDVAPSIAVNRQGQGLKLSGTLTLDGLAYVDHTQDNKLAPTGNLRANAQAVENFLYLDASADLQRTIANPFGPRPGGPSSVNTQSTSTYRLSPYIDWNISPRLKATARSENSWTHSSDTGVSLNNAYASRNSAGVALAPRPLGLSVAYQRDDSRFESSLQPRAVSEIARGTVSYLFGDQLTIGLRGGYEKNNYPGFESEGKVYGGEFSWRPTERTNVSGYGEHRFFGTGWQFGFTHRMPKLAFNIQSSRDVTTYPQTLLTVPAAVSVAALLDQALTTQYPDPAQRAIAVQDLIAARGLPPTLITPVSFYTEQISLLTNSSLNVVLLGARNSLGLTVFHQRTEQVVGGAGSPILPTSLVDNVQFGGSLTFSHNLTALTSMNLTGDWTRTQGLGVFDTEETKQRGVRLQVNRALSPRTNGFVGARYQVIDSNVTNDSRETAVFAGVGHRF